MGTMSVTGKRSVSVGTGYLTESSSRLLTLVFQNIVAIYPEGRRVEPLPEQESGRPRGSVCEILASVSPESLARQPSKDAQS